MLCRGVDIFFKDDWSIYQEKTLLWMLENACVCGGVVPMKRADVRVLLDMQEKGIFSLFSGL